MSDTPHVYTPDVITAAERSFRRIAGRMPYGGLVGQASSIVTLGDAVNWFDKLATVLTEVADANTNDRDRVMSYERDRDALRRVLGIDGLVETFTAELAAINADGE